MCHVRHINPLKIHPERIRQIDKELVNDLDYDRIEFPVWQKDFSKIETKDNICINVFGHENRLVFPIYISNQKFEKSMDLLLVTNGNKSHYVYIKDFERFMCHKIKKRTKSRIQKYSKIFYKKNKNKSIFAEVVYSVLVVKMY